MAEPTIQDVLDRLDKSDATIQDVLDRLDKMEQRLDRRLDGIDRKLSRHTEILVQTQEAVHGVQRHLALVPV